MQVKPFFKILSLYLVCATFLMTLPSQGWAMFIVSDREAAPSVSAGDRQAVQKILESAVIRQRLQDFGLSTEEALARITALTDDQIHHLARNLESLQAGADGVDFLIFLVLVAILVVVIIKVSGRTIIIR